LSDRRLSAWKNCGPPLEADGVDEQREEDRLDAGVDLDLQLADDDADQKGSRDPPEHEPADLDLPGQIAERDRDEEGQQRLPGEQVLDQIQGVSM